MSNLSRNFVGQVVSQSMQQVYSLEKTDSEISEMIDKVNSIGISLDVDPESVIPYMTFSSDYQPNPIDIIDAEEMSNKSVIYAGINEENVVVDIISLPEIMNDDKKANAWLEDFSFKSSDAVKWIRSRPLGNRVSEAKMDQKYSQSMDYFYYSEDPSVSEKWYFDFNTGEWVMPHLLTEKEKQEVQSIDQKNKIIHLEGGGKSWPPRK